ncbi:hypothetical protein SAMN04489764_1390 [Thermostaphylospora chromogena]|jgi:hypothetical protein|uniref:Uncharacterized protein n=1 Tax=Thermostaphylospora chromogena TaxID=35622 RepID=A0A1H1CB48_9ACTN|nr:hypothetical protein SAMN04489764_1390 [Thermostaphylospora chromogena]
MRIGDREIRPLGGGLGCLTMILVSILLSILLTVLINVLL